MSIGSYRSAAGESISPPSIRYYLAAVRASSRRVASALAAELGHKRASKLKIARSCALKTVVAWSFSLRPRSNVFIAHLPPSWITLTVAATTDIRTGCPHDAHSGGLSRCKAEHPNRVPARRSHPRQLHRINPELPHEILKLR